MRDVDVVACQLDRDQLDRPVALRPYADSRFGNAMNRLATQHPLFVVLKYPIHEARAQLRLIVGKYGTVLTR